jgi:YidC/Oxa1 family membrane protein insertase
MAIFNPILDAIGWLLSIFYGVIPNLGVSIILLTFTIMGLLYPLTAKQARSMIRMQMVQPEIKRIQAKYKNDRAALNEEMMKFYQENKINPLAGCLPLLVQMPIFFALFRVLQNPYKYVPESSSLFKALCTVPRGPDAGVLATVDQCSKGGAYGSQLPVPKQFLGMNLSLSAPDQLTTWASVLGFGLVALVMLSGYLQSRQAQKRTPAINKQMALVTKILPVFFGFISLNFPSGLVLYFFVSNLWRLGQQEVIFRSIGTAANPKHKSLTGPKAAAVVDADSRERSDAGPGDDTPVPAKPKKAPAPRAARPAPSGKPMIAPTGGGGLRGLFRPPPPPGAGATVRPATPPARKQSTRSTRSTRATTPAPAERPGQAGRRVSKKKKKR